MQRDEIIELLRRTRAIMETHVILEDGDHTTTLIRPLKALQFAPFNRKLCFEIVRHFLELDIHVVVSPTISGIPVAVEVGRQLEARAIFFQPVDGVATLEHGFELHEGERVVIVTDMLHSDEELQPAIKAIRRADARLVGIGGIVDVRSSDRAFNVKNVAAVRMEVRIYAEEECPVCGKNSAAS